MRILVGGLLTILGVLFVVIWPQFFDCMLLKVSCSDSMRKLGCVITANCSGNWRTTKLLRAQSNQWSSAQFR